MTNLSIFHADFIAMNVDTNAFTGSFSAYLLLVVRKLTIKFSACTGLHVSLSEGTSVINFFNKFDGKSKIFSKICSMRYIYLFTKYVFIII